MKHLLSAALAALLSLALLCSAAAGGAFLVCERDGLVAVLDAETGTLLRLTDTPLRLLPARDRAAVLRGVVLPDEEALLRCLEDLCS